MLSDTEKNILHTQNAIHTQCSVGHEIFKLNIFLLGRRMNVMRIPYCHGKIGLFHIRHKKKEIEKIEEKLSKQHCHMVVGCSKN